MKNKFLIRFFDIFFSIFGLFLLSPILISLVIIGYFDTGSPIFFQKRMGKNQKFFFLMKFRSMYLNSPSVPTHLASSSSITKYGNFLRKSKLDELLQLLNVFMGEMSLVGPRPNLSNQLELIIWRNSLNVYKVRPGITGLAQINKIDMSTPKLLAETDAKMIQELNVIVYFKYILLTVYGMGFGDRIVKEAK